MVSDLQTDDLSTLGNDELFSAIEGFCKAQPVEGWRHDFTEVWEDSAIQKAAAFANTFGGILIVGVKKGKRDTKCEFIGVPSTGEYKTTIASSIATNISPTPSYNVFECHDPGDPSKRYCVVRIRARKKLHLITKKSIPNPVYVRNEDEARPADAARLRELIDREQESQADLTEIAQRAEELSDSLVVRKTYADLKTDRWFLSSHQGSSTLLRLAAVPAENIFIELETSSENQFQGLIRSVYPRVAKTIGPALDAEQRGADFYEYLWFHTGVNYEARWRMTGYGGIASACQMENPHVSSTWSVVDLMERIVLFYRLANRWWEKINYFGDSRVHAHFVIEHPEISSQGPFSNYPTGMRFNDLDPRPFFISSDAIVRSQSPGRQATAEVTVNVASANTTLVRTTMVLLNVLLRAWVMP